MGVGYPLGRAGDWIDISVTDMQKQTHTADRRVARRTRDVNIYMHLGICEATGMTKAI